MMIHWQLLFLNVTFTLMVVARKTKLSSNAVIFYNVYIPSADEAAPPAISIVTEQLQLRDASLASNLPLFYTSIGKNYVLPNCTSCTQLQHISKGTEIETLTKLHAYCIDNSDKEVIYMHNKGSLRPTVENHQLRRMLTKSIFSKECLIDKQFASCNVCSARFSPLPHFHAPGNMWVASCSYVSKLIPPNEFEGRMFDVLKSAPKKTFGRLTNLHSFEVGTERFSAEHWIHSHPDVVPCDVYPGIFVWSYGAIPSNNNWTPNLVDAPRFSIDAYKIEGLNSKSMIERKVAPWFSLSGRIHEWMVLYGKIPHEESWTWDFYQKSNTTNQFRD